ncbi:hypothetical protein WN943_024462 [Citrus x changshan-huyou]
MILGLLSRNEPEFSNSMRFDCYEAHPVGFILQPIKPVWISLSKHRPKPMEGSFAKELYSECLQLSKLELDPPSTTNQLFHQGINERHDTT